LDAGVSLPLWLGAFIAALLALVGALTFGRAGTDGRSSLMIRIALALILALAAGWTLDYFARRDLAAERQALDARAFELTTRALAPGSALACLDAAAGAAIREPCEQALLATPQDTAAAVSYVAAQLALLTAAQDHARRAGLDDLEALAPLRRVLEADRFGIVAHVLSVLHQCTGEDCAALSLLQDRSRVSANLAQRPFESHLKRHMAGWSSTGSGRVSSEPEAAGSGVVPPVAGAKPTNELFFPSSSSIPPVSIMTAEPAAPRAPAAETAGSTDPAPSPRKPSPGAQPRQPASQGPVRLTPPNAR
jgi:hypothetical protein